MTMTMTLQDRMMVDTEYSSDNNGADPAFTNYTRHSHIAPRFTVMMSIIMMNMQKLMSHCWIDFVHKCKSLAILLSVCNVSQQLLFPFEKHMEKWGWGSWYASSPFSHLLVVSSCLCCNMSVCPKLQTVSLYVSLCVSLLQIVVSSPPSASDNMCPPHPTLFAAHLVVSLAE